MSLSQDTCYIRKGVQNSDDSHINKTNFKTCTKIFFFENVMIVNICSPRETNSEIKHKLSPVFKSVHIKHFH